MGGWLSLAYDPGLGLVVSSNTGFGPYITRISETLLNDDPQDDIDAYFYSPAGDAPTPSLEVTTMVPRGQFGDPESGIPYPVNSSVMGAPGGGGLVAVQTGSGSVVRVMENGSAEVLATLPGATAVGSYPTYSSPSTGLSVIIRVDSPVDVLLTAPDGKQIGVDLLTGQPVNDFGVHGFDGGPGEPRFFAIENPAPGDWDVEILGTGAGPFTITAYGIDLDQPVGSIARMTGMASVGSHSGAALMIQADGVVAFVPEPGAFTLAWCSVIVLLDYRRFRKSCLPR
jgi:hypothetical protein